MYTITSAAAELGCHPSTVRRAAARHSMGTQLGPRTLILSTAELAKLRRIIRSGPGNPNFVAGNHSGRPPEKIKKSRKKGR